MKHIYLETQRLTLREMNPDEAPLLFDLDSDPEVMTYLTGGKTSDMAACQKALEKTLGYYKKHNHSFGLWFAEEKSFDEVIGWFLLRPDKKNPNDTLNPELGYRLKKKFWGKGYATEGSLALLEKAFTDLNCDSVFAEAMKGNSASQNVMKKIGMKYAGSFNHPECFGIGADPSAVHYVITKSDWLK